VKKLQILSWILFDFGNSAFTTVIVTAFYVLYFKSVVMQGSARGDFYWGLNVTASMFLIGFSAPILGAIADYSSVRKRFMIFFALLAIIFTALLSKVGPGSAFLGSLFFIVANIGFEGSVLFNDSFLPQISSVENRGRISGWGWGIGYIGGILSLVAILPFVKGGFGSDNLGNIKYAFWLVAAQYLIFCLPAFIFLKDYERKSVTLSPKGYLKEGFGRVFSTLKEIKKYRDLFLLVIAFFIYNDGICTVIVFASSFANDTLHFTIKENLTFLIIINVVAAIGAISFGYIIDRVGAKKPILATLVLWIIALIATLFVETKSSFYIVGVLVGIALGSSQSGTRTLIGLFSPKKRAAEFFGFSAISGRFSAILGPTLFGLVSSLTGNQRYSVLIVILFFIVGFILLCRVNENRGIELARFEDAT
jgi:MFS transporter, UMF1 family